MATKNLEIRVWGLVFRVHSESSDLGHQSKPDWKSYCHDLCSSPKGTVSNHKWPESEDTGHLLPPVSALPGVPT